MPTLESEGAAPGLSAGPERIDPFPSGADELGAAPAPPPPAPPPPARRLKGEGDIGRLECISPRAGRVLGVAELGKNRGSDEGARPSSLFAAPVVALMFLPAPEAEPGCAPAFRLPPAKRRAALLLLALRDALPPLRVAESGAKRGLGLTFVLFAACGVVLCEFAPFAAGRLGEEEEGKARGEEDRGAWMLLMLPLRLVVLP